MRRQDLRELEDGQGKKTLKASAGTYMEETKTYTGEIFKSTK